MIVLAMHGNPPGDFPRDETILLFTLHARLEQSTGEERAELEGRYQVLESKMRAWPRTLENDSYYIGSHELASHLQQACGLEVIVGFNEFCSPSLDEALDLAAESETTRVIVITPMMTSGGEHSEKDIPAAIQRAQTRNPEVEFIYAWPFNPSQVAQFLAKQIEPFTEVEATYGA